jgi:hypothetical protein
MPTPQGPKRWPSAAPMSPLTPSISSDHRGEWRKCLMQTWEYRTPPESQRDREFVRIRARYLVGVLFGYLAASAEVIVILRMLAGPRVQVVAAVDCGRGRSCRRGGNGSDAVLGAGLVSDRRFADTGPARQGVDATVPARRTRWPHVGCGRRLRASRSSRCRDSTAAFDRRLHARGRCGGLVHGISSCRACPSAGALRSNEPHEASQRGAAALVAAGIELGIHQSVHDAWRRRYLLTKKVHIARLGEAKVGTSLRI